MFRAVNYLILTTLTIILAAPDAGAISKRRSGLSLKHRTQLELRLGVREDTQDDNYYDGLVWAHTQNDLVVSFGVNHWVDETTAFNFTVKSLAGDYDDEVYVLGVYSAEYSVVPVLVGFRKYLVQSSSSALRPYVALSGGPVFGRERVEVLTQEIYAETNTETALGAYFGAGIDFLMGRHFMVGVNGGYNLLSDFDEPVAGKKNYSSAELGVGFGLVF